MKPIDFDLNEFKIAQGMAARVTGPEVTVNLCGTSFIIVINHMVTLPGRYIRAVSRAVLSKPEE